MAGRGPAPKKDAVRRNKAPEPRALVKYDGVVRGPELPPAADVLPPRNVRDPESGEWIKEQQTEWHPQTVRLYEAFRSSPQSAVMVTEIDWLYLQDSCVMHHNLWSTGSFEQAAELRQRLAKFGATAEDRARLRMEVEVPEQYPVGVDGGEKSVVSIDAQRRRRLAGS